MQREVRVDGETKNITGQISITDGREISVELIVIGHFFFLLAFFPPLKDHDKKLNPL